jgi:acyl-CoA dehydrogenase
MDFAPFPRTEELRAELLDFMERHVYPAEAVHEEQLAAIGDPYAYTPVLDELKAEGRRRGLWNLFLSAERGGPGLTNLEYAPLCEIMGHSDLAPETMNCSAPDTGNMELLAEFGTEDQKRQWLAPLLEGEIRSSYVMTEPDVASSDATNVRSRIQRDGDDYVINGRKWFITGALNPRCRILIFMGVTDPDAEPHRRHSQILVPIDTPGVTIVRPLSWYGYPGHADAELRFDDVRVPASNLIGEEGSGFAIAQARLGPGRIHHCMRAIGLAERAFDLMCERALSRVAFGKPIAEQGVVQDWIAESRLEIEQARLLTLKTAWLMDTVGVKGARIEISAIKAVAPRMATNVIDRAVQVHGAGGISDAFPLARMWAGARTLHFVDGPDEVHRMSIARRELRRYSSGA